MRFCLFLVVLHLVTIFPGSVSADIYDWQAIMLNQESCDALRQYIEKKHEEWVNSKVTLDYERAAAGLPEYQKGILFEPSKSLSLFEQAMYFDKTYRKVISGIINTRVSGNDAKSWSYHVIAAISE